MGLQRLNLNLFFGAVLSSNAYALAWILTTVCRWALKNSATTVANQLGVFTTSTWGFFTDSLLVFLRHQLWFLRFEFGVVRDFTLGLLHATAVCLLYIQICIHMEIPLRWDGMEGPKGFQNVC